MAAATATIVSNAIAKSTNICNFFYSLALTEVVYAVVPQRVWDYRKLIEAKYPYKGKLYKLLAGSSVVHAVDGNSGQKTSAISIILSDPNV